MRDAIIRWADQAAGPLLAAAFHVAMLALPITAAASWRSLEAERAYDWHLDAASLRAAREALDRAVAREAAAGDDRREALSALVAAELDAGDVAAARGLLLAAPAALTPSDGAKLAASLPPRADDDQRIAAALRFLRPDVQRYYEDRAGPVGAERGAIVLGDLTDLAERAAARASGERVEPLGFLVAGIAAGLAAQGAGDAASLQAGASTLEAARRAGALNPAYAADLQARIAAALDQRTLEQGLTQALAAGRGEAAGAAVAATFGRALHPGSTAALAQELALAADIAAAVGPAGAVRLLGFAANTDDVRALRLLATAGGERALAVAGLVRTRVGLLDLAQRSLRLGARSAADLAQFALSVGVALATASIALMRELRHAWRGPKPPAEGQIAGADSQKRRRGRAVQPARNSDRMLEDAGPPIA